MVFPLSQEAPPETQHFPIGNIGAVVNGAPGVPTPAALANFGQLNMRTTRRIVVCHLHLIQDGAAPSRLNLEVYRRRDGVMTRLVELQYIAPAGVDFITIAGVPATEALRQIRAGDYLYCQSVTGSTIAGGGNGLTVDVHFAL